MAVLRSLLFAGVIAATPVQSSFAHNVWCHCSKTTPVATLTFFHKAGDVYEAISDVMRTWQAANTPLESGVIAEFEHAIHNTALEGYHFKETLVTLELLQVKLSILDTRLRELRGLAAQNDNVPEFESTVTNILAQQKGIARLSAQGVRYADVGGQDSKSEPIKGLTGIIDAQIQDLGILSGTLTEVIDGLRNALPLADKGEFARVMLSGRNAFGDKMPQFTDMMYAYERLYVQTCQSTIIATMQVYPKGFEWLKAGP